MIRNQKFRDFCDQVLTQQLPADQVKTICVEKFGLLKFKDYRERYSSGLPKFSSSQASFWADTSNGSYSDRKRKKFFMAPGEIIFRISLRDAIHTKNRKALVRYIEDVLEQRAAEWADKNSVKPSSSTQNGDYLELLRILDLVAHTDNQPKSQRLTRTQIFALVYPKLAKTPANQPPTRGLFDDPFNERWTRARKLITPERYLDLAAT